MDRKTKILIMIQRIWVVVSKVIGTILIITFSIVFIAYLSDLLSTEQSFSDLLFPAIMTFILLLLPGILLIRSSKKHNTHSLQRKTERNIRRAEIAELGVKLDALKHQQHIDQLQGQIDSLEHEHQEFVRSSNNTYRTVTKPNYINNCTDDDDYNELDEIDNMDGHEFEYYCAQLLKNNGFKKVEVTPGSGDQGVDILAEKNGIRYAIQCKNYASKLGNTPVQEVNAGRTYYKCDVGVVLTNSEFTNGAIELANSTNIRLWDRHELEKLINRAKRHMNQC